MLAFACAFTMFAGAAFTDSADISQTEAVDMLTALGVIDGYEDGSFRPDATITRAEAAKMIYTIRNGGNTNADAFEGGSTSFTDVYAGYWAEGYIKYCQAMGIISGKSTTSFAPEDTVTGTELAKMLLVTLGYDANKSGLEGTGWDQKTNGLASQNGLYEDVTASLSAACPRQFAAQIMYNAINADLVKWSSDANAYEKVTETTTSYEPMPVYDATGSTITGYTTVSVVETTNKSMGEEYLKLEKSKAVLNAAGKLAINGVTATDDYITIGATGDFKTEDKDYTALIGQKVEVLYKESNGKTVIYGVYATSDNTIATGSMDNLKDIAADNSSLKLDGKTLKLDNAAVYATNYTDNNDGLVALDWDVVKSWSENAPYDVTAIDNDDDGKYEVILVDVPVIGYLSSVTATGFTVRAFDADSAKANAVAYSTAVNYDGSATIKFDYDDEDITNPTIYEDAAKDDYVIVTKDAMTGAPIVEQATVLDNAKVTSTKDNDVEIDGTWYTNISGDALGAGDSAKVVTYNGYIMLTDDVSSTADVSDYALVTGVDTSYGTQMVRILKANGETEEVEQYKEAVPGGTATEDTWLTVAPTEDTVYRIESKNGKMKFIVVDQANAVTNGDWDAYKTVTQANNDANFKYDSTNSKTTLMGTRIATDAVIFAKVDGTYKVMTGAELQSQNIRKASAAWSTASMNGMALIENASSGVPYVKLAFIGSLGKSVSGADSTKYAYLVGNVGTTYNADEEVVSTLTIATGDDQSEVLVCDDKISSGVDAVKGKFVKYELNSDGTVDAGSVTVLNGQGTLVDGDFAANKMTAVAITGIEDDVLYVSYDNKSPVEVVMDDDTQIVYINRDDVKGAAESGLITADKDASDKWIANAYMMYDVDDTDKVVKVIFIDSDNDIKN